MKRTLSILAVLGIVSVIGTQTANAFTWSNLNPFNWGKCNRCEKKIPACPTGYAVPCDPCAKKTPCDPCEKQIQKPANCDACDKLQQEMMDR